MKIVFALGNPGERFVRTRHNVGYLVADALAKKYGREINTYECRSLTGKIKIGNEEVLLVKPLTFMNLSGMAVREIQDKFKLDPRNFLVINDDADLKLGRIKIVRSGGDAGHLGVRSVMEALKSDQFPRLRIGIDRPPPEIELREYVLQEFTQEEWEVIKSVILTATKAVEAIILQGIEKAMSQYN